MLRFASYAFTPFVVVSTVIASLSFGGAFAFGPLMLIFAVVPGLDVLVGLDVKQPDDASLSMTRLYRAMCRVWVPLQIGLLAYALHALTASAQGLDGGEGFGLLALQVVGLGVATGAVGITYAHELMHRSNRLDRGLAEVLMASVGYTLFCIEHVLGHHRNVGTPADPATSRYGESLYSFLPRTVVGGFRSAIALERARCERRGIGALDPRHRLLRYGVGLLLLQAGILLWLGPIGWLVWAGQAVVAILLLEIVNYLEHYGLERRRAPADAASAVAGERFERVRPEHSWNSAHAVSNRFLANLARHADHHANANRSFDQLRHFEEAPQLPTGYGAMLLLAMVPPAWFAVMNPRVQAWRGRAVPESGERVGGQEAAAA